MSAMAFNLGREERTIYPSQSEAAWILSLRFAGIRILSIREGR